MIVFINKHNFEQNSGKKKGVMLVAKDAYFNCIVY